MKKRIVCFGDSNTWGYNPISANRFDENTRWTGCLSNLLGNEYTVIEEGLNSRTNVMDDPYNAVMAGVTYLEPCIKSHKPFDLLIIMLGTNDTKLIYNAPSECIARGAERLIKIANTSTCGINDNPPKVLLVCPPYVKDSKVFASVFNDESIKKSKDLAYYYEQVAIKQGCYFMDASKFVETSPIDGIHLDENGHKVFAQEMYKKVKELIG